MLRCRTLVCRGLSGTLALYVFSLDLHNATISELCFDCYVLRYTLCVLTAFAKKTQPELEHALQHIKTLTGFGLVYPVSCNVNTICVWLHRTSGLAIEWSWVINVCTDRTSNSAVHRRLWGVSYCCFAHLEQSATSRHISTISTDFAKEETEAVFVQPQFPLLISCSL